MIYYQFEHCLCTVADRLHVSQQLSRDRKVARPAEVGAPTARPTHSTRSARLSVALTVRVDRSCALVHQCAAASASFLVPTPLLVQLLIVHSCALWVTVLLNHAFSNIAILVLHVYYTSYLLEHELLVIFRAGSRTSLCWRQLRLFIVFSF